MKQLMREYRLASAECAKHEREKVAELSSAARAFRAANKRWPYMYPELAQFAALRKLTLDDLAFNQVTLLLMPADVLQIQYEFRCGRFDMANPRLVQHGTVSLKP